MSHFGNEYIGVTEKPVFPGATNKNVVSRTADEVVIHRVANDEIVPKSALCRLICVETTLILRDEIAKLPKNTRLQLVINLTNICLHTDENSIMPATAGNKIFVRSTF